MATCSVCMEGYISPKVLPCQHTFCVECITRCMAQLLWYEQVIIKFVCLLLFKVNFFYCLFSCNAPYAGKVVKSLLRASRPIQLSSDSLICLNLQECLILNMLHFLLLNQKLFLILHQCCNCALVEESKTSRSESMYFSTATLKCHRSIQRHTMQNSILCRLPSQVSCITNLSCHKMYLNFFFSFSRFAGVRCRN